VFIDTSTPSALVAQLQNSHPLSTHSSAPHQTGSPDSPMAQKLRRAASEFESILLESLWKSMKSTFAASDDDSTDPAHNTLDDMGTQAMSSAIGKAQGLGLGKMILKRLEPLLAHSQNGNPSPPTGKASAVPADTFFERH
jgi:Rod binding domain-containing protein